MIKYSNFICFKATCVSEAMMNHFHFFLRFLTQISLNFGMYVFSNNVFSLTIGSYRCFFLKPNNALYSTYTLADVIYHAIEYIWNSSLHSHVYWDTLYWYQERHVTLNMVAQTKDSETCIGADIATGPQIALIIAPAWQR